MRIPIFLLLSFATLLSGASLVLAADPPPKPDKFLYLSAGGNLRVFAIQSDSGELKLHQTIELAGAGPIGQAPNGQLLYVVAALPTTEKNQRSKSALATFRVNKDGTLTQLAVASANLRPGYLRTDRRGKFLAGNHYSQGKVSIWKLDDKGIYRGETIQEQSLEMRAHSAVFSPDNRFLLVPATGPNKVFQLRFDASSGQVTTNTAPYAAGPQGVDEAQQPRHLLFHPTKPLAYTTLERQHPGVGVWAWDAAAGQLTIKQNIVTQPADSEELTITTADLHLTANGKFLYVSNRDVTDRKARVGHDSIVGFRVHPDTGELKKIGHTKCEHVPRSFYIERSGRFLYVAGQGDDRLGVYRINQDTGELDKIAQYITDSRPIWVHCHTP